MYKNKTRDFKNNSPETNYSDSAKCDQIDLRYGFKRISDNVKRTGYLINIHSIDFLDDDRRLRSALDLFFIQMDGTRFKYTVAYMPYFLICVQKRHTAEITQYLKNKFGSEIAEINEIEKEDLDLPNHLTGIKQPYIKLSFNNQNALTKVRKIVSFAIKKRKDMSEQAQGFASFENLQKRKEEPLDCIIDMREHDVPYHIRVSIDLKIFCGMWYDIQIVSKTKTAPEITSRNDIIERPEPVVLAFDIETTKLPLKFPDANFDQVMMISYMIDGQGYLITNREIISTGVNDFEYSPKPEFEGHFKVFNESNECNAIQRFFNHVIQIRPHIIVTYNGDFFDWPFIETRASVYGLSMSDEIGFSKSRDGVYVSRPSIHMDCLCWVKRDSYLPVGSHGLKAVAKAKLHYDPIELDPEEMCKMAVAQPQVLSNYSVSDAIATYYLYMKYVHPFVFALSTIIPMEPDEILRKGSGTLCETLLMVEAYHANIVYPNKQQTEKNMLSSDGLLIDSETYVGGHVEALECGVYRADIPCRFRLDRKMITHLMSNIDNVLEQAIVIEEGVPLDKVKNYNELAAEVKQALQGLYDIPYRLEQPVIYHLDVGAMYPNIILTNRLQPSAIVNDADCAACDFNCPDAKCKRPMKWQWRGEMLPASKNELYRIKQQLEMEKFPPLQADGPPRSFHELSQEDQEAFEKKRLTDYCRKVYKKTKVVKLEERASTICQKENSFYVDTVRAFRDRRYEYKGLTKVAKRAISEAIKLGDAAEIKAAKSKEVLYDSLQLAHKCILNSFYGYVMRKGARWHSMPMAGIVCLTGSNIITKARIIIESIGRPLELDTDGIWCILPASFPQVLTVLSDHEKKTSFNISYPNAVLNNMVKAEFTNDQYHELVKSPQSKDTSEYQIRSENSIFFEVDGPYLAMVLPAAKEEGKKLKKRYAVFNFDGSLAELKGFEVKRRGELQLIKNFQSSVFESFLSGSTLEECYNNVAKIANYWLDVLYSNGQNLPDKELFELVSENRSMSKKLEDYGTQKSTSISTARRLAEFLGDQMVKDAGLACKYVISRKPDGAPVTERAIPLAIFQCEPAIRRHYLRRWLRDSTVGDEDIRDVLDWGYYIERLSGAVQKIITIPAAMQGVSNPVPRVVHPDWLHKRMVESTCKLKQRQINEMFTCSTENKNPSSSSPPVSKNVESNNAKTAPPREVAKKRRLPLVSEKTRCYNWKQSLGPPPPIGEKRSEIIEWILYQKKKWLIQFNRRQENKGSAKRLRFDANNLLVPVKKQTVSEFLRRSKKSILHELWHIVHLTPTDDKGNFVIWAMVESELHKIRISIPRIFYVHQKTETAAEVNLSKKKSHCILPRSTTAHCIYKYTFQEKDFKCNGLNILGSVPLANIEGVYETNISLESRFLIEIGCVCSLKRTELRPTLNASGKEVDSYTFEQLEKHSNTSLYLENTWKKLKKVYLYQNSYMSSRQIWGIFLPSTKRAVIIVLDKVRSNQMPNINTLYAAERSAFLKKTFGTDVDNEILPKDIVFESFMEVDLVQVYRQVQRCLSKYKEQKKGPTLLCTQTLVDIGDLKSVIPLLSDFPIIKVHISDDDSVLRGLGWQKLISRVMIRHFLNFNNVVDLMLEQSRYLNVPIGNLPSDPVLTGTDIFYARLLQKNNFILWWSASNRPDLGGKEAEDCKLLTELNEKVLITQNNSGFYSDICIALAVQNLAITALLQSNKIQEMDNVHSAISFDKPSQSFLKDTLFGGNAGTKIDYSWTPAFGIMRVMVNGWLREISQNKNVFSDYHIAHFYRWVRSSNSSMNDPGISKMLTNLMEKLFKGIMKEFTRLGVAIVFADLNTVIINSKKKTVNEAFNYIEFIIQSIRKNELYHSVQLIFDKLWINLVWLDSSNFAGMTGVIPQMESNREFPSSEEISNDISRSPDIHFTLGPMSAGPSEFKLKFEEFAGLLVHSLLEKESAAEAVQNISHNIFCLVVDLHKKYNTENPSAVKMFVETIIKVLRCHEALKTDIISLQRNLLKVIGATEFGKDIGSDVLDTFVLNGVTCKACNEWRDVDLMNDKLRTAKDGEKLYVCHRCHVTYEKKEIEQLITEDITRRLTSFTLQDIKCLQCNAIKKDNFSENCVCGGNYTPLFKIKDARVKLDLLLKISESNKMNLLHSTLLSIA